MNQSIRHFVKLQNQEKSATNLFYNFVCKFKNFSYRMIINTLRNFNVRDFFIIKIY